MSWFRRTVNRVVGTVRQVGRDIDITSPDSVVRSGLRDIDPSDPNSSLRQKLRSLDPSNVLEATALPLAQAWKNDHPNAAGSDADYQDCVVVVAAGLAATGAAVGGPLGAAVGAGGGIAAAGLVCRRVM